jgi:O-antigen ligase
MNTSHQPSNYLLYGVMLMLLVFVARIQELFVFLLPLRLGMMSVFISVLLFLISSKPGAQVPLSMIPQVKIVLAIFALILVSVPFSVWPGQSFNRVEYFLLTVIFFLLSIYSVNNPADLRKLLWAFIGGVVLLAFFTINSTGAGRHSASATYDPNDIAMLFVITLPIIYFFMTNQNGIAKIIAFLFMLTIIFAFILTGSRGGFLGFFVIMMLIFFMDKFRSWTVKILILGVLIFSFVQFAPDTYWERISTILNYEEDYNMTSETGRKTIWLQGLGLMKDNPVTGVGAGAFTTAMGYAYGERGFKWSTAHNAFVEIGAELGIGGFVLFILTTT